MSRDDASARRRPHIFVRGNSEWVEPWSFCCDGSACHSAIAVPVTGVSLRLSLVTVSLACALGNAPQINCPLFSQTDVEISSSNFFKRRSLFLLYTFLYLERCHSPPSSVAFLVNGVVPWCLRGLLVAEEDPANTFLISLSLLGELEVSSRSRAVPINRQSYSNFCLCTRRRSCALWLDNNSSPRHASKLGTTQEDGEGKRSRQ